MAKKIRLKDIANKIGVSTSTVSLALTRPEKINRKTRQEILELCDRLGYVKKKRQLTRHNCIGIMSEDYYITLGGGFYNFVTIGILKQAKKQNLSTIIDSFHKEDETPPSFINKGLVDGLIVVGRFSREHILQLKQENIPLVLCGHPIPDLEIHTVVPDGRAGIYEATKHLIGLGHRKIGMITGGQPFDPITSDRLDGYRFALSEADIRTSDKYVAVADFYDPKSVRPAVEKLLSLDLPPTTLVCACDNIALSTIQILKEKGLRVPKDISVIGFDDIPYPDFIEKDKPQLTTARVNLEQMGEIALEILLDIINNPAKIAYRHTLPTKLVVRKTTGAPKKELA